MPQNDVTEHLGLPLPYAGNQLAYDVEVLRDLGSAIDAALHSLQLLVADKADSEAINQALGALQKAINDLAAARVQKVNGVAGVEITLGRADLLLGPANGPSATELTYDASGRVSTITETLDGKPVSQTIDYDANGRVQKITTTYRGRRRVETLAYDNGRVSGTTATEADV